MHVGYPRGCKRKPIQPDGHTLFDGLTLSKQRLFLGLVQLLSLALSFAWLGAVWSAMQD